MRKLLTKAERVAVWESVAATDGAQEAIAPERHRPEGYSESGRAHAAMLLDAVRGRGRVLDFGCGDGRVTGHLVGEFAEVWGADASPSMLRRMNERCPDVRTVEWDGTGPWLGATFDVVCSFLTLLHHRYDDGARMLRMLAGAVAPGGELAVQVPVYDVERIPVGWTSVGAWTADQFHAALWGTGLVVDYVAANPGECVPTAPGPLHTALHLAHRPA